MNKTTIYRGDLLKWFKSHQWLAENDFIPKGHAILCDPPYALPGGFMNAQWDNFNTPEKYQAWCTEWGRLLLSFVHPGAVMLCFGGTRTYHRLAAGLEDAGWIVSDCLQWVYASGFPKNHSIGKAIDKAQRRDYVQAALSLGMLLPDNSKWDWTKGEHSPSDQWWEKFKKYLTLEQWQAIEREIIGKGKNGRTSIWGSGKDEHRITAPATDAAHQWEGHGTALAPAYEPILVCRAPWTGTYAGIAQEHGTGAINVEGGRIGTDESWSGNSENAHNNYSAQVFGKFRSQYAKPSNPNGRWPKNFILGCDCESDVHRDDCAVAIIGAQSGESVSSGGGMKDFNKSQLFMGNAAPNKTESSGLGDSGTAARFYFQAKAAKWEREAGLHQRVAQTVNDGRDTPIDNPYQRGETERLNIHPTLKPIRLTEYLARLILPPALSEPRRLLVPFSGSGSEMIGAMLAGWDDVAGFEQSDDYADIAQARIAWWAQFGDYDMAKRAYDADLGEQKDRAIEVAHGLQQMTMFGATGAPESVNT